VGIAIFATPARRRIFQLLSPDTTCPSPTTTCPLLSYPDASASASLSARREEPCGPPQGNRLGIGPRRSVPVSSPIRLCPSGLSRAPVAVTAMGDAGLLCGHDVRKTRGPRGDRRPSCRFQHGARIHHLASSPHVTRNDSSSPHTTCPLLSYPDASASASFSARRDKPCGPFRETDWGLRTPHRSSWP
jgi:hypothetical protein